MASACSSREGETDTGREGDRERETERGGEQGEKEAHEGEGKEELGKYEERSDNIRGRHQ